MYVALQNDTIFDPFIFGGKHLVPRSHDCQKRKKRCNDGENYRISTVQNETDRPDGEYKKAEASDPTSSP